MTRHHYPETYRRTPNVGQGQNECKGVVYHHTAGRYEGAVEWLCNPQAKASAHVVIAKDGRRKVLAADNLITWHAGRSEFRGRPWCNTYMLGVEFELLDAEERLTIHQLLSAMEWLAERWDRYGWDMSWMTHHREVSPGRKVDLNEENWLRLKAHIASRFGTHEDRIRVRREVAAYLHPADDAIIDPDRMKPRPPQEIRRGPYEPKYRPIR